MDLTIKYMRIPRQYPYGLLAVIFMSLHCDRLPWVQPALVQESFRFAKMIGWGGPPGPAQDYLELWRQIISENATKDSPQIVL
jgi:hypothetical protein